ncbi:hypothetical protein HPB51_003684 [Rhipicephalus microplus]|uniref:Uncharacterized protein n=1 Tax=Rhipicephalus microplus TaxID=6941 RepID=A0A9J6DYC9_RHIMP|nr:hypothetical protein HPB51_003684 [Rhipicephalus microplus]
MAAEMARRFSRCYEKNVLRKYAADSSGFCGWAVRSCLRKEPGYVRSTNHAPFKYIHKRPTCKPCTCFYAGEVDKQVEKEPLTVFLEHINKACELDSKHQLKLLPHLKLRDLDPSHFEKMNVATAHALFHHSTAAGLRYLVHRNHLPEEALTTAFFLEQVFRWLTIMTSRTMQTALSELCPQKGDEAECFLVTFIGMVT